MTPEQLTGLTDSHLCPIHRLHPEAATAYQAMREAASKDGFCLDIASGFRDFERQRFIWNNKFNGVRPILDSQSRPLNTASLSEEDKIAAILRWSAMPGASRHHWGTDIDVYSQSLVPNDMKLQLEPWEYQSAGHQYPIWEWLQQYAEQFGFYFPYAIDQGGVAPEPWHLSYRPVAENCLNSLTAELLTTIIKRTDVAGAHTLSANMDDIISRYVLNICR